MRAAKRFKVVKAASPDVVAHGVGRLHASAALVLDGSHDPVAQQELATGQMPTALVGNTAVQTHVEHAVELLGEVLLEEAADALRGAFDRVSGVLVHQPALT